MTTIPSEWICKGLSSFLAPVPASRSSQRQEEVPIYSMCARTSLPSELRYFIHNAIGYTKGRFGRSGHNLVTSTSGLKTKQMWDDAWLRHIYYYSYWLSSQRLLGRWNGSVTAFVLGDSDVVLFPSQTLDCDCFRSRTFSSQPVLSSLYTAITSPTGGADSSPAVLQHNIKAISELCGGHTQLLWVWGFRLFPCCSGSLFNAAAGPANSRTLTGGFPHVFWLGCV